MNDTKKQVPTKPVLFADTRSDAEKFDPMLHRGHLDPSRIRGYSEIVQANDIAKADDLKFRDANQGKTKEDLYRQIGAKPQDLPIELQWLPVSGTAGAPISTHAARQLDQYVNQQGFRIVTWSRDDSGEIRIPVLDEYGYSLDGPSRFAEDGTIRRGPDSALYWRSGEVARKWEAFKFDQQAEREGARPEGFTSGAYGAPALDIEDSHEQITVTH